MKIKALNIISTSIIAVVLAFGSNHVTAQIQKGLDMDGEAAEDQSGVSVSMPDANTVAIGARKNDGNGSNSGHVRIYAWNGSVWNLKGNDLNGEAAGDESGCSVSMPDANTVAIGAMGNSGVGNSSGHVRVYGWNGSTWIQKGVDIDGLAAGDYTGFSVDMPDANTLAIGAIDNDANGSNAGQVRMFVWNGSSWVQKGLSINGEAAGDRSGYSVSMPDANTVAIGAINNSGSAYQAGHVRIYTWNGTAWVQKGPDIDGEAGSDYSGWSVSMPDANTVAIGAPNNNGNGSNSGHVRIYSWNGSAWIQKGMDIDGEASSNFSGISVSMPNANTVAIGASHNSGNGANAGHVRIYDWNGSAWVMRGMDMDGEAAGDYLGWSVSMTDAHTVAIGAINNDGNGNNAGHARVFDLCVNSMANISPTACNSYISPSGNHIWTASGIYFDTIPNSIGCDSLVTINLTILSATTGTDSHTACGSFTWIDGNTYTVSNNSATYFLTNGAGCDSIVTLNLTILNPSFGTDTQTACKSYTWIDGNTYTGSNNSATHTLTNAVGCDSIVTLNLTIDTVDVTVINNAPTLTANAAGAMFQWIDCTNGNSPIIGATNASFVATISGSYAVMITQNGCTDTSACEVVNIVALQENRFGSGWKLFPNPTTGPICLKPDVDFLHARVIIRDLLGHELQTYRVSNTHPFEFFLDGPVGIYWVEIETNDERTILKVVKE